MDYRLYFHGDNGRILSVTEITFAADEEAIAFASGEVCDQPMELWQQERRVASFPAVRERGGARSPRRDESPRP